MSRFFQQLMARQQGQIDTAKPLITPRFAQPVYTALETDGPVELTAEQNATESTANVRSDAFVASSSLSQAHSVNADLPTPFVPSRQGNQRQRISLDATDVAARLAQVSQWIGELATVVERSHSARPNTSTPTALAANEVEQSPIDLLARQRNQSSESTLESTPESTSEDTPESTPTTRNDFNSLSVVQPSVVQPSTDSLSAIASLNAAPSRLPSTVSDNTAQKSSTAKLAIQPALHRLQPVLSSSLQPVLQLPPPTVPKIQISIGRVEIRAIPAKPAPRPQSAPAPKRPALSLEQYLQRRSREG